MGYARERVASSSFGSDFEPLTSCEVPVHKLAMLLSCLIRLWRFSS
jgi:hypothetical protein